MQATKERPILFSGEMGFGSPWRRGQYCVQYEGGDRLDVEGWVSQCGVWGLCRHEQGNKYRLSHLPTGRRALDFQNHELATAFIEELARACDMSGAKFDQDIITSIYDWARECLGATRDDWPQPWCFVAQGE